MRDPTYNPPGHIIVTVAVTPELHKKLRIYVAKEERTIKSVVTQAIEQFISEEK